MKIGEKLRSIRQAEGLSRSKFCQLIDTPISTMEKYELGLSDPGATALTKITQHVRFQKYTLWLMADITAPESGQIAPALKDDKQTG